MALAEPALPVSGPLTGRALWFAAIVLASANFIAVLDITIANVSVPSIAGSLGVSANQGTWIITSYAVAEAIIVPLTGWLAGRFGAVRVFTLAMMFFGGFSALCGVSGSLGMIVAGRIMQGLSGGCLMPLSQTLLLRIFPKEKAPTAMALWAMTTLVAPVLGPIFGGWICEGWSWPFIFFINVPIAVLCGPVAWRLLARYQEAPIRAPIDKVGLGLLILFVGALQILLDTGKDHDWFASQEICALALIAVIGFAAFLIWELHEPHPIVNLRVFRHRGFSAAVVTLALGYGAMFGSNVMTPLWLQTYMGYDAIWAGMAVAWTGVLAVIFAPLAALLLSKKGDPRAIVSAGLCWVGLVTVFRCNLTSDVTYWQIAWPLVLMGIGLPLFFVPLTTLALGSVEEDEMAAGAGLQNFLRTISGAIATSLVTTFWDDKTSIAHAELAGLADRGGDMQRALSSSGMAQDDVLTQMNNLVQSQSVMIAVNQIMTIVTVVIFAAAAFIWLAPKPQRAVDIIQAGH